MPKITTQDIKNKIPQWLGTDHLRDELKNYYIEDDDTDEDVAERAESLEVKLKNPASKEEFRQAVFNLFRNGNQWSREEKRKITEDFDNYFYQNSKSEFVFAEDFAGESNKQLVADISKSEDRMKKCWMRLFTPKNSLLGDNFRLEVVSTPEDDAIVGWLVVVD